MKERSLDVVMPDREGERGREYVCSISTSFSVPCQQPLIMITGPSAHGRLDWVGWVGGGSTEWSLRSGYVYTFMTRRCKRWHRVNISVVLLLQLLGMEIRESNLSQYDFFHTSAALPDRIIPRGAGDSPRDVQRRVLVLADSYSCSGEPWRVLSYVAIKFGHGAVILWDAVRHE